MSESYLSLNASDRTEALETAADKSGRPAHLLEKDVWVVWCPVRVSAMGALKVYARFLAMAAPPVVYD